MLKQYASYDNQKYKQIWNTKYKKFGWRKQCLSAAPPHIPKFLKYSV